VAPPLPLLAKKLARLEAFVRRVVPVRASADHIVRLLRAVAADMVVGVVVAASDGGGGRATTI
jgi:hypothetical protein